MAELLEGIEELRSRLNKLNVSGVELEMDIDLFNESGFDEDLSFLDLPHDGFSIEGDVSNYRVVTAEGDVIDLEAVNKGILKGDLGMVIKELKFPDESLSLKTREYMDIYRKQWESKLGTQDLAYIDKVTDDGKVMESEVGVRINNADQLEAVLNDDANLKAKFDNDVNALRTKFSKNSNVQMGKWVKRGVILTAAGLTVSEVWKMINNHRKEMNGCWLVNTSTGNKCKIATMSKCGKNDKWLCANNMHVCGSLKTENCFPQGKCLVLNDDGSCGDALGSCVDDKECHKYCGNIDAPEGYRTYCVNVNFWGAADDFFGDVLAPTKWFKWILYIGIAVVILVIIVMLIK